eukprot:TRINITY_DN12168_c0_g1_i13.p2 TRINITY_DN12168_c0_g1~~TRINITY_DN12168_c0_g1_i13.p2  ORF type:complete len:351 (+),score=33.38 TRINITY_DN12168_c0_g1_i13:1567-2619(+)
MSSSDWLPTTMVEFELSWQFAFELAASTACLAAAWISLRIYQQRQRDDAASVAALERLRELCQNAPCLASKSTPDAVAQDMLAKFKDRGNSPDKPIRILSLDGGGVRGTYSARLLTRLEEAVPGLFDHIDVTAGTSTGVLVAGLLAMGYSPSLTQTIFNTGAVAIFRQPPWWREYNPFICNYDGKWKERCFKTITQDGTVKQLSKYLVCTAFRTHVSGEDTCSGKNYYGSKSHWHPDVITNLPLGPDKLPVQSHMDMELYKVAMLATAAPTWFPAYEVDFGAMCVVPQAELLQTVCRMVASLYLGLHRWGYVCQQPSLRGSSPRHGCATRWWATCMPVYLFVCKVSPIKL